MLLFPKTSIFVNPSKKRKKQRDSLLSKHKFNKTELVNKKNWDVRIKVIFQSF